ncbi:antitoxin Xre/MbcA/ParS toxin-binding domain-containing protein [uncultured Rhodoblastus sp.]|uniref:type II RES/Xre toxin-antitoxin system antitoxin n=1 Tax=uncultured Rhodoblastus sp. TaxID=543037 RepID=UPI0025EFBA2C|nr:antitoxin Xre/MbcA/ParS toxin-binding domain-containing protein [uncultured Rhodoblastus sp.]
MDTIGKATRLIGLNMSKEKQGGENAIPAGGTVSSDAGFSDARGLLRIIREGFPAATVAFIVDSGRLSPVEVDRVVLPRKTLANRRKVGTLTAEQSDRLLRVARIIAAADEVFGHAEKADAWLRRATSALSGEKPLDLLDTEEGAREVETLLTRIGHGIAA